MKRKIKWQARIGYTIILGLITTPQRTVQAGWTGAMNGVGYGWADANVTSFRLQTSSADDAPTTSPSASIPPVPYKANAPLPDKASLSTEVRILGMPGYIWQASTFGANGDTTDNADIEGRVTIVPADCAQLEMDSTGEISQDGMSGVITVNANATAGTGLLLRGYEYTNGVPASLDDLTNHSSLKFDVLLVGPFDLNKSNCTALVIPFTTQTGHTNMYFVSDGVAKSNPLTVGCAANPVVFGCADPVVYPVPQISGGCGGAQYTYSPTADKLPLGVVASVTVTAFDQAGDTNACSFTVDTTAKAFTATYPTNVVFACGDPLVYPTPQINGGCDAFLFSYNPPASALVPGVPTVVTATVTDTINNLSRVSQFTATRQALTFSGFFSPIGGTGGSCTTPFVTVNRGSNIPVKFEDFCQGVPFGAGTPTLSILQCPSGTVVNGGNFQMVQNVWHFNWDTTGLSRGAYQLIVTLQDGTTETVFVGVK